MNQPWNVPPDMDFPAEDDRYVRPEVVSDAELQARRMVPPRGPRVLLPVVLFLATCASTMLVGLRSSLTAEGLIHALAYAGPLMGILLCHEFGHFIQARRYHVPASLPYFIPMPISLFGTMGAVIGMGGRMGDRKALFDIGISGPLAGLGPALICSLLGLSWSTVSTHAATGRLLGEPLLFQWMERWTFGPLGPDVIIDLHPLGFAGWVGIFITALNLIPIGQLDGGHILYALLRKRAHVVATSLLLLASVAVVITQTYNWLPMLALIMLIGPKHPPTANDDVPLGTGRIILGWLTLAFFIIGFTPVPLIV